MAALNTLRTKGGVFLSVVIGLSLLAFLLGDGSFFGNSSDFVVGSVDKHELKSTQFREKTEKLTFVTQFSNGKSSLSAEETEQVNDQIWQSFVIDAMFDEGTLGLGLRIGDKEMTDMITGKYPSPVILSIFGNEMGRINIEALSNYNAAMESDQTGKYSKFWAYLEDEMTKERIMEKYITLVSKGFFVTDLEVESVIKNESTIYDIDFVSKSISTIPDSTVKVDDKDLRAYYEKHLERFRRDPFCKISYAAFDVKPSAEDITQAQEYFTGLVEEFKTTTDVVQFINLNSEDRFDARYLSKDMVPANFRDYAFGNNTNEVLVSEMIGDNYSAVKVVSSKVMPDSISFRAVTVPVGTNIDSVINVIKGSENGIFEVATAYSVDPSTLAPVNVNTSDITEETLLNAKKNEVVKINAGNAIALVQILRVTAPVNKVQLAKLSYAVIPGQRTEQLEYAKATNFVEELSAKDASFDKIIEANGQIKRVATINRDAKDVNQIKGTKEIIRWAHTSKVGAVSHVISIDGVNYVATLTDIFDGGHLAFEAVKDELKMDYIAKVKTDMLIKELAGNDNLEALAAQHNTSVGTAEGVSFSSFFIPNIGIAPEVAGAVTVLAENKVSNPTPAGSDVVVFKIKSKTPSEVLTFESAKTFLENNLKSEAQNRLLLSLILSSKVKDNRVLYF